MLKVGNMCLGKPKIYIQHITTVIDQINLAKHVGHADTSCWNLPVKIEHFPSQCHHLVSRSTTQKLNVFSHFTYPNPIQNLKYST